MELLRRWSPLGLQRDVEPRIDKVMIYKDIIAMNCRRSEIGSQKSASAKGQRSNVGGQKTDVRWWISARKIPAY